MPAPRRTDGVRLAGHDRPVRAPPLPIGLLLAAAGCADDGDPAARCLPARLAVEPAQVEVGGQVTLNAPAAGCDLGYDDGAYYEVYLALLDHADAVDLGDVEVGEDGSFRAVLTVPADAPPGPASLGGARQRLRRVPRRHHRRLRRLRGAPDPAARRLSRPRPSRHGAVGTRRTVRSRRSSGNRSCRPSCEEPSLSGPLRDIGIHTDDRRPCLDLSWARDVPWFRRSRGPTAPLIPVLLPEPLVWQVDALLETGPVVPRATAFPRERPGRIGYVPVEAAPSRREPFRGTVVGGPEGPSPTAHGVASRTRVRPLRGPVQLGFQQRRRVPGCLAVVLAGGAG